MVFRDADFAVQFVELNPVSARLVDLLQRDEMSADQALKKIAEELKHSDPAVVIQGGLDILRNLLAQGAILGTWVQ